MSKAYWGMTRERKHIMVSYVGALFFFVLQSIFAFHILDGITGASPSSIIATVVRTGYVCVWRERERERERERGGSR